MNPFVTELSKLAAELYHSGKLELKSGYSSKKERLCRLYIKAEHPECLAEIAKLCPDPKEFLSKSVLYQRAAVSLVEAICVHGNIRYARNEVTALLELLYSTSNPINAETLQELLGHDHTGTAKRMLKVAEDWGFIKWNGTAYVYNNHELVKLALKMWHLKKCHRAA